MFSLSPDLIKWAASLKRLQEAASNLQVEADKRILLKMFFLCETLEEVLQVAE